MIGLFTDFYNYFFLLVSLFYNLFSKKIRPLLLLIVSFLFFYLLSSQLVICLLMTILSVYFSALLFKRIEKDKKNALENVEADEKKQIKSFYQKRKKYILILCILFNFLFLFLYKYLGFFAGIGNGILHGIGISFQFPIFKLIAPIGISFYTLQAYSYLLDVYNGKIEADDNFYRVALFISFFPQIVEGPMARYSDTALDLYSGEKITYHNFCFGLQRIAWGILKKVVIADRINILVKTIFNDYAIYSGPICFLGALGYTIMLYMEFSSTMDVVIGIGEIFGVTIPENFRQPFFSKNISEFWTRWHISLGLWFKDYIYYPISLSKPLKKITVSARKVVGNHFGPLISGTISLFVVWFLNGLWHGAGWTFLLFGMYHFLLIFLENLLEPFLQSLRLKMKIQSENTFYRVFCFMKVVFLVVIGELIFRAPTVEVAFHMLHKIFSNFHFKASEIATLGLDLPDYFILIFSICLVFLVSILKEKNISIREVIGKQNIVIRWILYYLLIFYIIVFGAYGAGYQPIDPIYADF